MTNSQTPAQIAQKATEAYERVLAQGLADNDPEAYRKAAEAYLRVGDRMTPAIITPAKFAPSEKRNNCAACTLALIMRDCAGCAFYTPEVVHIARSSDFDR